MTMKFPIEMITSLSSAPKFSVVIWDEQGFYLDKRSEYNYKNVVDTLKTTKDTLDNFLSANSTTLSEVPKLKTFINTTNDVINVFKINFQNIDDKLKTFNTTLSNYSGRISPVERKIQDLVNDLQYLRTNFTEVSSTYDSMDSRLKLLEASGGINARVQLVEQQQNETTRRLSMIEEEVPNMNTEFQAITLKIQNIDNKLSSLESSINTILSQIG